LDFQKRDALLLQVGAVNKKSKNLVLVDLESFFEGNDDPGSIWCNLESEPTPTDVFRILKTIRERDDVADVRIMVTQYDGDEDEWPFSDTVIIVTSQPVAVVETWFGDDYAPDETVVDNFARAQKIPVPVGMKAIAAWWD
jgi:hypothetical protein